LDEASKLSKSLYDETVNLLKANEDILIEIAEELLKKETLNNSEIDEIIKKRRTKEGNEEKQVS
jgi:cell division protease FtsH